MLKMLTGPPERQIALLREQYQRKNLYLRCLPSPFEKARFAGELLAEHARHGVYIWGDSDVDGTSATAIMLSFCRTHGFPCDFHVPERNRGEAYGLGRGEDLISRFRKSGCKVLLTVDCGIQDQYNVLYRLRQECPDAVIIVTDHHLPGDALPEADIIVDAWLEEDGLAWRHACGAAVAWLVASIATSSLGIHPEWKKTALGLVGLATITDVMDMSQYVNAILVRNGMDALPNMPFCRQLMRVGNLSRLTTETIGFQIGPRLNAAGRLDSPNILPDFYLGEDCEDIAIHLDFLNSERKRLEQEYLVKLEKQISAGQVFYFLEDKCPSGILGVLAGKIAERTGKAACCMRNVGMFWSGSARIPRQYSLTRQLAGIALDLHVFTSLRGHAAAAGISFPVEQITPQELLEYMQKNEARNQERTFSDEELRELENYGFVITSIEEGSVEEEETRLCASLPPGMLTLDFVREIEDDWGPFGHGFPPPLFCLDKARLSNVKYIGKDRNHVSLLAETEKGILPLKWWFGADAFREWKGGEATVFFTPQINVWNGTSTVEGVVQKVE